jgi:SAM-dependent methyltransferase
MSAIGFPAHLLAVLSCRYCFGGLTSKDQGRIIDGEVECIRCKKIYSVRYGIILLVEFEELDDLRKSEIKSRDEDALRYDRRLAARYEKEVVSTLRAIGDVGGKTVIEYGAGTGRLTREYAAHAKTVIASDFSFESLKVLSDNLPSNANVGLVCADATDFPLRPGAFDLALATQFYEHLPTKELRENFLAGCALALRPGGAFISTTYHYDLRMRLRNKQQEGMHPTGIFYHYYTADELRRDIGTHFFVQEVRPIDITLPLEARIRLSPILGGLISRLCERIPLLRDFGHLLMVVAYKINK